MAYNPQYHNRRSIRLKGYDYSQAGFYFITLCIENRINLFGEIKDGEMHLNTYGEIAKAEWEETPLIRKNISLGAFIIMPDHFHSIIQIEYSIPSKKDQIGKFQSPSHTIGSIIRGYKGATTKKIKALIRSKFSSTGELQFATAPTAPTAPINPPESQINLSKSIWQRNYWEHIIRNEEAYHRISRYIINNPKKWEKNKLNGAKGNQVLEPLPEYNTQDWMI